MLPSDRDDQVPEWHMHMEVLEFQLFRFQLQSCKFSCFFNAGSAVFNHALFTFIHLNLHFQTSIKGANLFFSPALSLLPPTSANLFHISLLLPFMILTEYFLLCLNLYHIASPGL